MYDPEYDKHVNSSSINSLIMSSFLSMQQCIPVPKQTRRRSSWWTGGIATGTGAGIHPSRCRGCIAKSTIGTCRAGCGVESSERFGGTELGSPQRIRSDYILWGWFSWII